MKARQLLLFFMLLSGVNGFCATFTVAATSASMVFSPDNISITTADVVNFNLASIHNAVEVSQANWIEQIGTPLPGGFNVGFGGGTLNGNTLSGGVHYYVCQNHIGMGMKGRITVTVLGVNDFLLVKSFSVFPNPATELITIQTNDITQHANYRIIDINGREVESGNLNDITTQINIGQFPSGVYFLQVGDDRRQVLRLIKK